MPSERAKLAGSPVQVDITNLEPGGQLTFKWRGMPVFILRRTSQILQLLNTESHLKRLRDPNLKVRTQQPDYAANNVRSIRDEIFVAIGLCTHFGCVPTFRPDIAPRDLGSNWLGGYFCPCHASRFDLAGRVFKSVPSPTNLAVPPYRYISDVLLEIGVDAMDT